MRPHPPLAAMVSPVVSSPLDATQASVSRRPAMVGKCSRHTEHRPAFSLHTQSTGVGRGHTKKGSYPVKKKPRSISGQNTKDSVTAEQDTMSPLRPLLLFLWVCSTTEARTVSRWPKAIRLEYSLFVIRTPSIDTYIDTLCILPFFTGQPAEP